MQPNTNLENALSTPPEPSGQSSSKTSPGGGLWRWLTSTLLRSSTDTEPTGEARPNARRFDYAVQRLTSPVVRCFILAVVVTGLLTVLGTSILNNYHARAHHHFDSASYRYSAILLYYNSVGQRWTSIVSLLQQKDSLDLVVRLLLYPKSLTKFHGHLAVQVPLMTLFCSLALWYTYKRTGTFVYGVAALSCIALFGTVYHPVQGLMDYWKDNLAVWLLGSALLSWYLSEGATRRGWGFLCGVMLSMLALQRVVVAFYGTAIFLPLIAVALVQRYRDGTWRRLVGDALAFGIVPLVVASFLVLTQAKGIIHYYGVAGYDYAPPSAIADYLWNHPFATRSAFRYGLLAFLVLPAIVQVTSSTGRAGYLVSAFWPIFAFLALVIATKAKYHSFSAVLLVLTVTAVCRLVPSHLSASSIQKLALTLISVAIIGGVAQVRYYSAQTEQYVERNAHYRKLFRELGDIVAKRPAGTGVGFFFDEAFALVELQLYFDRGNRPSPRTLRYFSSVHPSYYRASFGDTPPEEIAESLIAKMEKDVGMVAVVPSQIEDFARRVQLLPGVPGVPVPVQVNGRILRHIQASPLWRATHYLTSEVYGPLLVFQLSATPLSQEEKWGSLNYQTPIVGLNLVTAVAPGVRQLGYSSPVSCPPRWLNGVSYQGIGAGDRVAFSLLTDRSTEVMLRAGVKPGSTKAGTHCSVVVRHAGTDQRFHFSGEGELTVPLQLQPGLNEVEIRSADQADVPPPTGEARPPIFELCSPHLLPVGTDAKGK
ncbi:MAG: hypothetical protein C0467_13325 [Planctomycetaceae bacterium]|nr:hypothetical protein [Planctomycetaceae bacterium]